nr:hypothetical protein 10 [bacterium]
MGDVASQCDEDDKRKHLMKKRFAIPLSLFGGFIGLNILVFGTIAADNRKCLEENRCTESAKHYTDDIGNLKEYLRDEVLKEHPAFKAAVAKIQAEHKEKRDKQAAEQAAEQARLKAEAEKEAEYEAKGLYNGITKGIKVNKGEEKNYATCLESRRGAIDMGLDHTVYDCDRVATWVDPIKKRVAWLDRNGDVMGMTWKCERDVIKPYLKDPGSYKHVDSKIVKYDPEADKGTLKVTYRAKNSFGGYAFGESSCVF